MKKNIGIIMAALVASIIMTAGLAGIATAVEPLPPITVDIHVTDSVVSEGFQTVVINMGDTIHVVNDSSKVVTVHFDQFASPIQGDLIVDPGSQGNYTLNGPPQIGIITLGEGGERTGIGSISVLQPSLTMPLPLRGAEIIGIYDALDDHAVMTTVAKNARPITVGRIATDGWLKGLDTADLKLSFPQYDDHIDMYVLAYMPSVDEQALWWFNRQTGTFIPTTTSNPRAITPPQGMAPTELMLDYPVVSGLTVSTGDIYFAVLAVPTRINGDTIFDPAHQPLLASNLGDALKGSYHLWITHFTVSETLPLPTAQTVTVYEHADAPVVSADPAVAHPIKLTASGNTLDVSISLLPTEAPADHYILAYIPALDPTYLFWVDQDGWAHKADGSAPITPWKSNTVDRMDNAVLTSGVLLPDGEIAAGLITVPAGSPLFDGSTLTVSEYGQHVHGNYDFWATFLTLPVVNQQGEGGN